MKWFVFTVLPIIRTMKSSRLIPRVKWHWAGFTTVVLAQTCLGQVYLSNLSYLDTSGSSTSVITVGGAGDRIAQEFLTGPNPGGYSLTSVTLAFNNSIGNPTQFILQLLNATSAGQPGLPIGQALTGNTSPNQAGNYTYSASGKILQPNQNYFLQLEGSGGIAGDNNQYEWYRATTTSADSNDGWEIEGNWYSDQFPITFHGNGTFPGALEIDAVPLPEPSTVALLFILCTLAKFSRSRL